MKKTLLAAVTALALAGAMMIPVNMLAKASGSQEDHEGQRMGREGREHHPEIRQAIRHLEMAKQSLKKGAHDFSGHRAEAIKHTDAALEECHKALESDEK